MKVVFTIDTEPSIAGAFRDPRDTPLMDEPVAGLVNGQSEALGFLISLMKRYEFTGTFFVETVHNEYFSSDRMGKYVTELLKANQDIQLHLHPTWRYFRDKKIVSDDSSVHSAEFMAELMHEGKQQIKNWTGNEPVALRTGNFSIGANVYKAMNLAGLSISSNICVNHFKPIEPELNVTHGIHNFYGITEIPVTCFYDPSFLSPTGLRHLQITATGGYEMVQILDRMEKNGHKVAMLVTHPFEFIKKDDFRYNNMRPNKMVQNRLEYIFDFLKKNDNRFQVVPIAEAANIKEKNPASPIQGSSILSLCRSVTNFINDKI